jgi:hypothetical protein
MKRTSNGYLIWPLVFEAMELKSSSTGGISRRDTTNTPSWKALIISPAIYRSAQQEKFIPLLRERDGDKECLLAFCAGRKYIDFCDDLQFEDAYEALIRLIHGQPELKVPLIGTPPKHI